MTNTIQPTHQKTKKSPLSFSESGSYNKNMDLECDTEEDSSKQGS